MRILALALGVPFPPIGGGLTRTFHLLRALAADHEVTLAAFTYGEPHDDPPYPLRIETVPWQWSDVYCRMTGPDPAAAAEAARRLTFDDPDPWCASAMRPEGMEAVLRAYVQTAPPDLVLLEGTPLARFLPVFPPDLPCVLDFFDIHSVMAGRALDTSAAGDRPAAAREAERTLAFERAAARRAAACLAVSEPDAVAARTLLGAADVHLVPNGVDTSFFVPSHGQDGQGQLLFTGRMSYEPNVDAACYFAAEILPLVRRRCPHARFHIVGAAPPLRVSALASESVVVHGHVPDIRPYFAAADVVVVPIRSGGGTRLKVLEAAASGKAIVSTPLGVEGLAFTAGRDLIVADTPAPFAAAVVGLLGDGGQRAALAASARGMVGPYDWEAIGATLRSVLASVYSRGTDVR